MRKIKILLIALILILGGMFASRTYAADDVRILSIREFRPFTNMKYEYTVPNNIKYTVHKIFDTERDTSQLSSTIFSKALYCLRGGVGFGAQNAADNQITYSEFGDMYENAQDILMLYEGFYETQLEGTQTIVLNNVTYNVNIYNAILWILDEAYLPVDKLDSEGKTVYNQAEYKKELLDKAGIPTSQQGDITKDEIEVIQQLAIWYFTNYSEQKEGVVPTLSQPTRFPAQFLTITDLNGNSSNNMENSKERNLNKLYQYFVYGAINNWDIYSINNQTGVRTKDNSQNETYFDKTVKLEIESIDEETRLPDPNAHYYLVGPFKIKLGENERADAVISTKDIILYDEQGNAIGKFYDIAGGGVNKVYEFLQADKTTVVDELIKGEEYYIKVYKLFTEGFTLEGTNPIPEEERYALDEESVIKLKTSSVYTMSKAIFLIGDNGEIDQPVVEIEKEKIVEEDEITNEKPKKFDLSLRKYITKINNVVLTETRVPEINLSPLNSDETTAEYKHRKDPVKVKKGDKVTYNITIYNEGEKAGRATKIIDQLPTGLKYSNIKTAGFVVEYNEQTNQVIITRDSRETTNLPAYENGKLSSETIEIECEVLAETQDTVLTNVAWIAEAYDEEGSITITDQQGADRDSEPSTKPNVNKDNMEDYKGITNETDLSKKIYYPGYQDDDDFEKLIVEQETQVKVEKVWSDNNNQDGIRPESIKVQLKENGQVKEEVELNANNNWEYTFKKLPLKENGEKISYSVEETNVPEGYEKAIKETTPEGRANRSFEITNTYIPEETEVTVVKKWVDNENEDGIRPTSVKVQLIANGEVKEEVELSEENNWEHTFEKLPVKENGLIINYEVEETNVPEGYEKTIKEITQEGIINRSFEITNTYIPEETEVTVVKKWVDNDDQDGIRPTSVKVQLLANGEVKEEVELNEENNWKHTFKELPVKENGQEISYEVEEKEVPEGYEKSIKETTKEGTTNISFEITNTHICKEFDLALRKFITSVKRNGEEVEFDSREPQIDTRTLLNGTTATYEHSKEPLIVKKGDIVTYTLRIYNEGEKDGYAQEITDYIPEGLALILGYKENSWWHLQEGIDYDKQLINLVGETNGFYKTEEDVKNIKIEDFEDGIVTDLKDVKLATGKVSITTSKLSKEMDSEDNLIKAFDSTLTKETAEEGWQEAKKGEGGLYYKDVQVSCLVIAENTCKETLTNIAEITEDADQKGKDVTDRDSTPDNVIEKNEDDDDYEPVILRYYDLALRKFITGVERNGKLEEITSRIPVPKLDENGKIQYEHTKDPVHVANNNIVTYTIRVYNEGTMEAYAEEITDDIPEGLEYLPEHETNKKYEWVMVDKEGNITEKVEEAEKIITDYLSEEKEEASRKVIVDEETGETVESETRYNKLRPYDNSKPISTEEPLNPDYKDVKVAFKVIEPNTADDRIIINSAQITEDNGEDEDSDTENWNEGEDDQDREYIEVDWFDLSLLKWVTKTIVTVDGKTTTTETGFEPNTGKTETEDIRDNETPEPVAKVEIDRKKINKTTVKFVYSIRVTNEGNIAGYATEITDYIPEGLEFIESDNTAFGWQKEGDNKVITRALETVLLQPGESANVEIVFRWKNDSNNLGVKTNVAEITEDYNDNDAKDIDSTVDNKVDPYEEEQEDDDDFALVLLTIKTGKGTTYTVLIMSIIVALAGGVYLIKKYVLTY